MIVKGQYAAPAARHEGKSEADLRDSLESWTVMVKDSSGSHDGWFWSNPSKGQRVVDSHRYPFDYPVSGFGLACIRCHAATQSPGMEPARPENEFTFASLRNIAGFPGTPIVFRDDQSWRRDVKDGRGEHPPRGESRKESATVDPHSPVIGKPRRLGDPGFTSLFHSIKPAERSELSFLPPVTHDWVVGSRDRGREFVTSN
jgi:hypothetical protein